MPLPQPCGGDSTAVIVMFSDHTVFTAYARLRKTEIIRVVHAGANVSEWHFTEEYFVTISSTLPNFLSEPNIFYQSVYSMYYHQKPPVNTTTHRKVVDNVLVN